MVYYISKRFHFSAAHFLANVPETHPCRRLHGHNYIVEVVLQRDRLDAVPHTPEGMVVDYRDLDPIKRYIDKELDHRNLNDAVPSLANITTAERLAAHLLGVFKDSYPELVAVRVSETPSTWAVATLSPAVQ